VEYRGRHAICDMILENYPTNADLETAIEHSITLSNMRVVSKTKKEFHHHDSPIHFPDPKVGETVVWILAESHFTLHTYPEHSYISVDCYTCGNEGDPALAINYLKESLNPTRTNDIFITRGII